MAGHRWPLALLLSVVLHLVPAALPVLLPAVLPRLPITVEILPARLKPPAAAAPDREPRGAEQPPGPGPARPRRRAAAPLPAPAVGDLSADDPSVAVILRMAPLRASPHRPLIEGLLAAFPDARLLATADPAALARRLIDETEALLITTTDPTSLFATALLSLHGEEVDLLPAPAPPPPWEPRRLARLGPRLSAFGGDEVLRHFAAPAAQARLLALARAQGPAALSAELRHLERFVVLEGGTLPAPRRLRLSLTAEERPALRLVLDLADADEAIGWEQALPGLIGQVRDRIRYIGLGPLLDGLSVTRSGATVEVRGRLPRAESGVLLQLVRFRLMLLPLPQDARTPDMGPPDL